MDRVTEHYYRVYVGGYVFPALAAGATAEEIREAAKYEVESGNLDVTQTSVESEWDE